MDNNEISIDEMLNQLQTSVNKLKDDSISIEDSMTIYKESKELQKTIQAKLDKIGELINIREEE